MESRPLRRLAAALLCAGLAPACATQETATPPAPANSWPPGYLNAVNDKIAGAMRYPPEAQQQGQECNLTVRTTMNRSGNILQTELVKPCQYDILNQAALDLFKQIGTLPPVPDGVFPGQDHFVFAMPVNYVLTSPPPDYLTKVSQTIANYLRYPETSQRNGEEGDVLIRVHMQRDGLVTGVEIIAPSPYGAFNEEALDVVKRIGRLPRVPDNVFPQASSFVFTLPINFRLH